MDKKVIIGIIIVLIAVLAFFAIINRNEDSEYIAVIASKRISVEEYQIYLYEQKVLFESVGGIDIWETEFDGQPPEEVAKKNAFESLLYIKIAVIQAEKMGLTLTVEEKSQAKEKALEFLSNIDSDIYSNIREEDVTTVMEEMKLFEKLYAEVTKNFEISEPEFEIYYQEYLEANKMDLTKIFLEYIFVSGTDSKIHLALQDLQEGAMFEEVLIKYSDDYIEGTSITEYVLNDNLFTQEIIDIALSLDEGEISEIIQTDKGSYILNIKTKILEDTTDLKEELRNNYIEMKKAELYEASYHNWKEGISVSLNDDLINTIDLLRNYSNVTVAKLIAK